MIALALRDLYGLDLARWQLARLCQRAENVYVGAPTGIMDQTAAACCEPGHALFLDTRDLSQRQIPFDLAAEGLRLLVVDTQVKHAHSGGEYGKRRAGCEKGAALLGVAALPTSPVPTWTRRWTGWARRRRSAGWSAMSSRRTSASNAQSPCCAPAPPAPSARSSPRATPRCATTSASPARNWTWSWRRPSPTAPWVPV